MLEDEVYKLLDGFHDSINTNIIVASQEGGFDSEEYEDHRKVIWSFKTEFEWIRDNFEFEKEYHHELIKEIISLMDDHVLGDNDALFSLKYILYELNVEFNPYIKRRKSE